MIGQSAEFADRFRQLGWEVVVPDMEQTLTEVELAQLLPGYDGWIIGDDPATRRVVEAGASGRLKAAVKWGVGTDNIDFRAFADAGIPVDNTPAMFGDEVADIAIGYLIALARRTFEIDRGVRAGAWPKPPGVSLAGKTALVVGFGDIGRKTARRLVASAVRVIVCDPAVPDETVTREGYERLPWPEALTEADFLIFTCALTPSNYHMLDAQSLELCKRGVCLVNVARGPLIDEEALARAQEKGVVEACALDVFEKEPLPAGSALRQFDRNIFGSHNASNTRDAVLRTSGIVIEKLAVFLRA